SSQLEQVVLHNCRSGIIEVMVRTAVARIRIVLRIVASLYMHNDLVSGTEDICPAAQVEAHFHRFTAAVSWVRMAKTHHSVTDEHQSSIRILVNQLHADIGIDYIAAHIHIGNYRTSNAGGSTQSRTTEFNDASVRQQ